MKPFMFYALPLLFLCWIVMSKLFFERNISAASVFLEIKDKGVEVLKDKVEVLKKSVRPLTSPSNDSSLKSGLSRGLSKDTLKRSGLGDLADEVFDEKSKKSKEIKRDKKKQ